jgi:hypothetical protein
MKKILIPVCLLCILLYVGCISQQSTNNKAKYKLAYKVQMGASHGGIVENKDMKQIPNTEVDAFTGATNTGFNTCLKVLFPVRRNAIETGVDYLYSHQTFIYKDNVNGYHGERMLGISQCIIPLTYNIGLFRKKYEEGLFTIKLGYLVEFSYVNINDATGNLPAYEIKHFSKGYTMGLTTSPFHFKNGSKLGLYLDIYRGSRIYKDFYNQKEFKRGGTSFLKYGISFQF